MALHFITPASAPASSQTPALRRFQRGAVQIPISCDLLGWARCEATVFALDIVYCIFNSNKFLHNKHYNPICHKYPQQSPKTRPENAQRGDASVLS